MLEVALERLDALTVYIRGSLVGLHGLVCLA
jgi:hypothetical protein